MTASPGPRPPAEPQRLDAGLLAAGTADLGLRLHLVEETASTNALAAQRVRAGDDPGTVVVAEHQSAGRGRLDRAWHTPRGAAVVSSLLLRPAHPPVRWPWLPLLTGLATARTLERYAVPASVKWPNDVLVGPAKIAGILLERVDGPSGPVAVVGVGVNAGLDPALLPEPLRDGAATSVALASGRPVDRTRLLLDLLGDLVAAHEDWCAPGGPERLRAAYATGCVTVGREVHVQLPGGGELLGRATGVDDDGRLVVRPAGAAEVAVSAGDVVHVRARADGA